MLNRPSLVFYPQLSKFLSNCRSFSFGPLVDIFPVSAPILNSYFNLCFHDLKLEMAARDCISGRWLAVQASRPDNPVSMITVKGKTFYVSLTNKDYPKESKLMLKYTTRIPSVEMPEPELSAAKAGVVAELLERNSSAENSRRKIQLMSVNPRLELFQKYSFRPFVLLDNSIGVGIILSHFTEMHESPLSNVPPNLSHLLLGMHVGVSMSKGSQKFTGVVREICGPMWNFREHLLSMSTMEETKNFIRNAPDDELVVSIQVKSFTMKHKRLTYCTSQLYPLIAMENAEKFNNIPEWQSINVAKVVGSAMLSPEHRRHMIEDEIQRLNRQYPFLIPNSISDSRVCHAGAFPTPQLLVGQQASCPADDVGKVLKKHGCYKLHENCADVVLCGMVLGDTSFKELSKIQEMYKEISSQLSNLGINIKECHGVRMVPPSMSLQQVLDHLGATVVVWFSTASFGRIKEASAASKIKTLCVLTEDGSGVFPGKGLGRHVVSQFVENTTCNKKILSYAAMNIASAICGKLGHIPFCLAPDKISSMYPVSAAIGTDVSRLEHGSSRIDLAFGVRYELPSGILRDAAASEIKGECVPERVWRSLLDFSDIREGPVVIHRDGRFQQSEVDILRKVGVENPSRSLLLVEITKNGGKLPRFYNNDFGKVVQPQGGSFVIMKGNEALLVTSIRKIAKGTASPVLVKLKSIINDDQAITEPSLMISVLNSIYRLTKVHHGSLFQAPKIPLTTFAPDKAAYTLAAGGVRNKETESVTSFKGQQFWL